MLLFGFGQGDVYSLEGNFARVVDLKLLGEDHLWKGKGIPFDPEGLLSTIPAAATVISGYLTGRFIQISKNLASENLSKTVCALIMTGISAIVIGKIWDTVFPINKYLWTSSYVVYTSGWAILFLAILLWLIDIKKIKKWHIPFDAFGMNPLFIYVLSILWIKIWMRVIKITQADSSVINGYNWMFTHCFSPVAGNYNGSLLFAVIHVIMFCGISLILYRQKIFIKI